MKKYEILDIEEFGRRLIMTNDLDPLYVALYKSKAEIGRRTLCNWLLAYWCFYHAGVASYMSELDGEGYWKTMMVAARNETGGWPRGKERRHFRAVNAINSIEYFMAQGKSPSAIIDDWYARTLKELSKKVQQAVGFGPWIAFKVADMMERVLGCPISFDETEVMMYSEPKKAAWMLWNERMAPKYPPNTKFKEDAVLKSVVENLTIHFSKLNSHLAPPRYERPVNIQEIETILCKWKSHKNGHYPLNNDIHEIRDGLGQWVGQSRVARILLKNMPEEK